MTLYEFVAEQEETEIAWAKQFVDGLLSKPIHEGDCTGQNFTCNLCLLEHILNDFKKHCR